MAAMIACRRSSAKLLEKLLISPATRPAAAAAYPTAVSRAFNTSAQRDDYGDERSLDVDSRGERAPASRRHRRDGDFPSVFSEAFDPFFGPTRSLSQVLNLMDQMMENPFRGAAGARRGWDAREDEDALHLRIDMPGLGKEHVRVSAEQNTLIIRGEGEKEAGEEEESGRRYSSRVDLPPELYKMDQIKAEMKNGVLKVTVPKLKPEERKDVINVQIE